MFASQDDVFVAGDLFWYKQAALQQLEQEQQRYQDLLALLQSKGINPEQL